MKQLFFDPGEKSRWSDLRPGRSKDVGAEKLGENFNKNTDRLDEGWLTANVLLEMTETINNFGAQFTDLTTTPCCIRWGRLPSNIGQRG